MPKGDPIVEAEALRPMSLGDGGHVAVGDRFHGKRSVLARLVGMKKARFVEDDDPEIGEPAVTGKRAKRAAASADF